MRINEVHLTNKNKLNTDYRNENEAILSFFDYKPFGSYAARLEELSTRKFNRDGLVKALKTMNRAWGANDSTLKQIDQLRQESSVVVIGGQQAGLLTGPMYTVNKIISIITLAKQQAKALNVPVIPVFWIAGEDHDFAEINHTYIQRNQKLYKHIVGQQVPLKHSLSHFDMDSKAVRKWLDKSFHGLEETAFTKKVYAAISSSLEKSTTYVDFCARLVVELFPNEGIVLVDSGDNKIRQLEKDYFEKIIRHQDKISKGVYAAIQRLKRQGYNIPLSDVTENDGHLFYHDNNNERVLLQRKDDLWIGKNSDVQLTTAEMLQIASEKPSQLSNNVVTRPLMQDLLFPTLSFVAGDGEISYWASLQEMFHAFHIKMPPVMPRLSLTFVTKRVENILRKRELTAEDVLLGDVQKMKSTWLEAQEEYKIDALFFEANEKVVQIHQPIQKVAETMRADIADLAEKNLAYLTRQLTFLENKMIAAVEEKHHVVLDQFDELEQMVMPNGGLQERIWSPLPFVNELGADFIEKVINHDLSFENNHYLISFG